MWTKVIVGALAALAASWLALVVALLVIRPKGSLLRESMRLLPDLLRLLRNLAADRTLPRGVRIRLGLLIGYLALPFDLIPDFIPGLGYADDAIIALWVLRGVARRAGLPAVRRSWPGTEAGFTALCRLTGLSR